MKLLAATFLAMLLAVPAMAAETKPEPVRLEAAQLDAVSAGFYPGYAGIGSYDSAAARSTFQGVRSDLNSLSALLRSIY